MVSDGCALQVGPETTVGIRGVTGASEESEYNASKVQYMKLR
jgi:hypothetical protein